MFYMHIDAVFRANERTEIEKLRYIQPFKTVEIKHRPDNLPKHLGSPFLFVASVHFGPFRSEDVLDLATIIHKYINEENVSEIRRINCEKSLYVTNYFSEEIQDLSASCDVMQRLSHAGFSLEIIGEKSQFRSEKEFIDYASR